MTPIDQLATALVTKFPDLNLKWIPSCDIDGNWELSVRPDGISLVVSWSPEPWGHDIEVCQKVESEKAAFAKIIERIGRGPSS